MKKTAWYPAAIKPVRPGWYETIYEYLEILPMRWFDGSTWRFNPDSDSCGFGFNGYKDKWRGLTKEQK